MGSCHSNRQSAISTISFETILKLIDMQMDSAGHPLSQLNLLKESISFAMRCKFFIECLELTHATPLDQNRAAFGWDTTVLP